MSNETATVVTTGFVGTVKTIDYVELVGTIATKDCVLIIQDKGEFVLYRTGEFEKTVAIIFEDDTILKLMDLLEAGELSAITFEDQLPIPCSELTLDDLRELIGMKLYCDVCFEVDDIVIKDHNHVLRPAVVYSLIQLANDAT